MSWFRAIAIGAVTLLVAAWAVVRPEQLYVERVEFHGNVRAHPAELRHLADLRNGTTIWGVNPDAVAAGVSRHPWVRRAEVARRFPSTVVVTVEEHEIAAIVAYGEELFYVDDDGTPFLKATAGDLDHPVVTGLDAELHERHPDLVRLAVHDALWLLRELDGRGLIPRDQVSEVAFHRTHGWTVHLRRGAAGLPPSEVLFDLRDFDRQLRRLGALLDRGVDLSASVHVDLAPRRVAIVRPLTADKPGRSTTRVAASGGAPLVQ